MNHTRTTLLAALMLLGAAWTAAPSSLFAFQREPVETTRKLAPALPRAAWPPRPDAIVTLDSTTAGGPASLQPLQLWSAYAVPANRDLVITNAAILGEEMTLLGSGFQRSGEADPSLRDSALDPGAPLGWVFPAGSQVVLRNDGAQANALEYTLAGYLVARD